MRWRFRLPSGAPVTAARAVDTATHADYRRSGLFRQLTETAVADLTAEGCGFIFNTPNARSLPGYLSLGWGLVGRWPVYVRVRRPIAVAGALLGLRRLSEAGGDPAWGRCFGAGVEPWERFVERWGGEAAALVAAWEAARPTVGLRTPRDMRYLAWRYGAHPTVRYGVLACEEQGRLAGFAVLRPNVRGGLSEAVLAELFLRPESAASGRALLRRLARELLADYAVASFSAGTAERRLIGRAFFLRVPARGITLAARELNRTGADPARQGGWDLSLGDLEVF